MSTALVSAAQDLCVKTQDVVLADFVSAADKGIGIKLPANAMLTGGRVITTEAWNSTSTDVLDIGDAGSQNRYLNDGNIRALAAVVPLVPTGYVYPTPTELTARWTSGGGTPSTGKATIIIEYIVIGRAHITHE